MTRKTKTFEPKAGEPGSRIEYTTNHRDDPTYTGVVWSAGAPPATRWVQPDHDPTNQVLVRLRKGRLAETVPHSTGEYQRQLIKVCDRIQAAGQVFGVRDFPEQRWAYSHVDRKRYTVSWHINPECPAVGGKERHAFDGGAPGVFGAAAVIDGLLGKGGCIGPHKGLCRACVHQDLIRHYSYDWQPFGRKHIWWDRDHVRTGYEGQDPESLTIHRSDMEALARVDEMARKDREQHATHDFRIEDTPQPVWLDAQVAA